MVSLTLSISKEIKDEMDTFPEINWSHVAREAIKDKLKMLETFKEFTKNSQLTKHDSIKLGKAVNKKMTKRQGIKRS